MEIEKKFLVKSIPLELENYRKSVITQGYISTSPVIRIRQKNKQYYLTCKSKGLMAREEFEIEITSNEYMNLAKKVDNNLIEKTRYYIPLENNLVIELDIFNGILKGLVVAEVEFSSIEEANDFIAPDWFSEEVTHDVRYHNSYLCQINSIKDL